MKKRTPLASLMMLLLCSGTAFSQGTFTAIASGSWNTSGSWSHTGVDGDNIPDANDIATIPSGITINMTGGTIYQIASLTIQNGGTLNMNNATASLDIFPSGGVLQVDLGGAISNATADDDSDINFMNNASFIINGIVQADRLEFEGSGQTVNITGGGTLLVRRFNVNNTNVTVNLNTTGSFGSNPNPFTVDMANLTLNGTGTINLGGGGDLNIQAAGLSIGCHLTISDDIAVQINSANLTVTNGGIIDVGAELRVGPTTNDGDNFTVNVNSGGTLNVGTNIELNVGAGGGSGADDFTFNNSGTVDINGGVDANSSSNARFNNNAGTFTVGGSFTNIAPATGGQFNNNANALFEIGGALDTDMTHTFTASGNTVNYNGTAQTILATTYHHLTLSGSAAKTAAGNISVQGNWTRSGTAIFTPGTNTVTFNAAAGTAAQTIAAVGGETFNNLTINSAFATSPQIILSNAVTVSAILTMTAGNINLNSNSITLTSTANGALVHGLTSASGWMYGGSITRNRPASTTISVGTARSLFPLGSTTNWRPFLVGQTSNANSAGTMTVLHNASDNTTSTVTFPEGITRRHNNFWTLSTATITAGATYTLQAGGTTWGTIEAGAPGLADLRMSTSTGVVGTHGAATGGPDFRVNRTAVAFADLANNYHVASTDEINTTLPIELVSFNGDVVENNVRLSWETASELNNDFFTVERSSGGEVFSSIGQVKGNGTTSEGSSYALVDHSPIYGTTYYRLKQTDFDGTFTYSKIIDVNYDGSTIPVMEVFPNPSSGNELNIKITGLKNIESVPVSMYDQLGRECVKLWIDVDQNSGTAIKSFSPEPNLPHGMYILRAGHLPSLTVRFSVTDK